MSNNNKLALKFRCPSELEGHLPRPVPATQGVPDWLKAMPAKAFSDINLRDEETVKRCPPFIDAMTCGFLLPLICDLRIENGADHLGQRDSRRGSSRFSPFADRISRQGTGHRYAAFRSPTALLLNSTICGPSRPRKAMRCSSRIPSIALICHSPR